MIRLLIRKVCKEREFDQKSVVAKFAITAEDCKTHQEDPKD